ncbi:MAG TPA: low molecular weight protein arginine phosphatase [Candidatus Krumholzibacteria bacterium]|nr:low molecular weight protein arginine phosphatase [Candidatus Krumholzibacteria bacterium]
MLRSRPVIFVCEGNTCRSPMAEVMARQDLADLDARFASAGLAARAGAPATEEAQAVLVELGLDLGGHRARPVSVVPWGEAAWAIAMTRAQAVRLRSAGAGAGGCRIGVLGAPGVDLAGGGPSPACEEVADPWGGDRDAYRAAAAQIRRLLAAWRPVLGAPVDDGKDAG